MPFSLRNRPHSLLFNFSIFLFNLFKILFFHFFFPKNEFLTEVFVTFLKIQIYFFEVLVVRLEFLVQRIDFFEVAELALQDLDLVVEIFASGHEKFLLALCRILSILNLFLKVLDRKPQRIGDVFLSLNLSLLLCLKRSNMLIKSTNLLDILLVYLAHLLPHFYSNSLSLLLVHLIFIFPDPLELL